MSHDWNYSSRLGWVPNDNPLGRKDLDNQEPPEVNPLDEHCPICQMPMWMCECEQ